MSEHASTGVAESTTQRRQADRETRPRRQPPYHVMVLDDDEHSYEYVIQMLQKLFGHNPEQAYTLAVEIDNTGQAIVDTTTMERAEFKRDQILAFGKDWRIARCRGSMWSTIEPAE